MGSVEKNIYPQKDVKNKITATKLVLRLLSLSTDCEMYRQRCLFSPPINILCIPAMPLA
jgi:hypothetical protein